MVKRKRKDDSHRYPAFFKAFIPDMYTDKLKIPPAFAEIVRENLPEKAFLRDRYGNLWPVGLAKNDNAIFFHEGWPKFVKDNSVELGDFLVFQYDGYHVFDVKLLGHTACDKRGVGGHMSKVKEEENIEGDQEDGRNEKENSENNYNSADETDEEYNYEEEQETEEEEEVQVQHKIKAKKRFTKPKASPKVGSESEGEARKKFWRENKRTDHYGFNLFKSGKIPQPDNPYFVTKVRATRQDDLYIPVDFVKDHMSLDLPTEIILRDPKKREWPTKLHRWSDGRVWYSGGWRSLCRLNLVRDEDSCICEFVKEKGEGLRINVTIVRAEDK